MAFTTSYVVFMPVGLLRSLLMRVSLPSLSRTIFSADLCLLSGFSIWRPSLTSIGYACLWLPPAKVEKSRQPYQELKPFRVIIVPDEISKGGVDGDGRLRCVYYYPQCSCRD